MKPSLSQRFFASPWPLRLWLGATTMGMVIVSLSAAGFQTSLLGNWQLTLLYLYVAITNGLLGFVLGVFPGILLMGPLLHARARLNGAPFAEGDSVLIIGGPHAGVRTEVYEKWQGESVRVRMGELEKESFQDVMQATQIMRFRREAC